jgi:hypothetical protein
MSGCLVAGSCFFGRGGKRKGGSLFFLLFLLVLLTQHALLVARVRVCASVNRVKGKKERVRMYSMGQ